MQLQGFHHIGLFVENADKSLAFYTEGLGGKLTFQFPMGDTGKTIYLVDLGGNAVVEIIPRGNGEEQANAKWAHIAVNTDDADAAYAKAVQAGAKPKLEPQEAMLGTMRVRNNFVFGPDGEEIEFFQVMA
ncbi:VOC family protein [Ruminococcaceae bacterium OttesenSCG-928-L11]|nr:VOC family protein [Ruminococcaceae bacterium OttesenSCG-928-L11]